MKLIIKLLLCIVAFDFGGICKSNVTINDIEVLDEEFREGKNIEISYFIKTNKVVVSECGTVNEDIYVICGKREDVPYFAIFEKNEVLVSRSYTEYPDGVFNDLLVDDNTITFIGNYDEDDNNKILIIKVDLNGNLISRVEFSGDRDSYGKKIVKVNDNEYMFVGETYAKEFEGVVNSGLKSLVIGKLSKDNFNNNYVVSTGNDEKIDFIDALGLSSSVYILAKISGVGYYSSGGSKEFLALIKMTNYFDAPEYIALDKNVVVETSKMFGFLDKICFIEREKSSNMGIASFSKDLDYLGMKYYKNNNVSSFIDNFYVSTDNDKLHISLISNKKEYRSILDKDFNTLMNIELDNGDILKDIIFKNGLFFSFRKNNDYIFSYEMFIKGNEKSIFINSSSLLWENDEGGSMFGISEAKKEITYHNYNICYNYLKEVELVTNIQPFSEYDKGVELNFNSKGYLNGAEIESGYKVENEGSFLLELVASDGKKESIYFSVGSLSVDIGNVKELDDTFKEKIKLEKIQEAKYFPKNKIEISETLEVVNNKRDKFYLVASLLLGGLISSLIVFRKRKEKHA